MLVHEVFSGNVVLAESENLLIKKWTANLSDHSLYFQLSTNGMQLFSNLCKFFILYFNEIVFLLKISIVVCICIFTSSYKNRLYDVCFVSVQLNLCVLYIYPLDLTLLFFRELSLFTQDLFFGA